MHSSTNRAVETLTSRIYVSFMKNILRNDNVLKDPLMQSLISRATVALDDDFSRQDEAN
jgi:hypothetical protein